MNASSFMKAFFLSVFFITFANRSAYAQQKDTSFQVLPKAEAKLQWDSFKKLFPQSEIEWDNQTGTAHQVSHFLTKAYTGTAEEIAKIFLQEYSTLFGIKDDLTGLRYIKSSKTAIEGKTGIDYVKFQQFHDELPVIGTETILHITETGKVFRVYNRFYPEVKIVNKVAISKEKAISLAREKLKKEKLLPIEDKAELTIYPNEGNFFKSWQVQINHWRFYVDADDGNVLYSYKTILYQNNGTGSVYEENSCITPNRTQGNLPNLDNSGFLRGTNFDVQTLSGNRAQSATHTYNYSVSDNRFDQVEIYYQLERARAYFGNLGFVPNPTQTTAYANDSRSDIICNAAYDDGNNFFRFGIAYNGGGCDGGIVCNSTGQDGDVIIHEYTHQVIHQISQIDANQIWPGSIHEAVADYFSCSFFNNPCLGEPYDKNCSTCMRNIANNKIFPFNINASDPHLNGLILASALWDIRESAGQELTDWVAFQALNGLPANANFTDYATNALNVLAARASNIDNFLEAFLMIGVMYGVRDIFCNHGIITTSGCH